MSFVLCPMGYGFSKAELQRNEFTKDANFSVDDFICFFEKSCFAFFAENLGKLIAIGERK